MKTQHKAIREIRSFNRFYTGILGLLDKTLLKSPYSLTEVRVLFEISRMKDCTANRLIENLCIDRGYLSRMIKGFVKNSLVVKENAVKDARKNLLTLTDTGKEVLLDMDDRSNRQVLKLIENLSTDEVEKMLASMRQIQSTLEKGMKDNCIRAFRPDDLEYVVRRHREIYGKEYGFNSSFGDYVAEHVRAEFDRDSPNARTNLWISEDHGKPVGMIAIVQADEETAQLRYFLLDKEARGKGMGHRLMRTALDFVREKGYKRCFLLTLNILGAARNLYGVYGFKLTHSEPSVEWREDLIEERWEMAIENDGRPE